MRLVSLKGVFYHPVTGVRLVVWGDDFTLLGRELDLREVLDQMGRYVVRH